MFQVLLVGVVEDEIAQTLFKGTVTGLPGCHFDLAQGSRLC
jgi:hypothetical protein